MLRFSEPNKSLGQIRIGQPKQFTVTVFNDTSTAIPITNIKRGCGKCTQARMEVDSIPAHSSAPLYIVFTPDSTGIARKSVTINGTDIFNFNATVV